MGSEMCIRDRTGYVEVRGGTLLMTNATYDVALYTIHEDDFATVQPYGYLELDTRAPNLNETIFIPQHPAGMPKQFGMNSAQDGGRCRVNANSLAGYAPASDFGYACDTQGGSSGSPVIALDTLKVVGLHHLGSGRPDGTVCGPSPYYNQAVKIEAIAPLLAPYMAAPIAPLSSATPTPSPTITATSTASMTFTPSNTPKLLWLNSPGNPTGAVLPVEHLAKVVAWARRHGIVVASDECYAELDWRRPEKGRPQGPTTPCLLDPEVCAGSHEGLLAVYSLSKQSNLAGYRAAFVAGDPALVGRLLEIRRHAGMLMPGPVQAALVAALGDDEHVAEQRLRYGVRRETLYAALESAGYRIDHSDAGLYLWATRDEDCWITVRRFAESGILVAPGAFYGVAGRQHVRIALTGTDERVDAAATRLAG